MQLLVQVEYDADLYTNLQRAACVSASLARPKLSFEYPSFSLPEGSAIALQIWDIATNLDLEVKHIWSKPWHWWIKWAFFAVRYFPLVISLIYRHLEIPLSDGKLVPPRYLHVWYLTEPLHVYIASAAIEVVMMVRVYALYNQNLRVKILFVLLLTLEAVSVIVGITFNGIREKSILPVEFATRLPYSFVGFGSASFVTQVIILVLTATRYRSHFRNVPIGQLLFRDGVFMFSVITLFSLMQVIFPPLGLPFGAPALTWNFTLVSCAGSRIILNFQDFYEEDRSSAPDSVRLTTIHTTAVLEPRNDHLWR